MSTFDLIRYPIDGRFEPEDLDRIPLDIRLKWIDTMCIGSEPMSVIHMIGDPNVLNAVLFCWKITDADRAIALRNLKQMIRDIS